MADRDRCVFCTANVGDAIAVALAAAGQGVIVVGGKTPCEQEGER